MIFIYFGMRLYINTIKGSDRLCKVVELTEYQCCGKLISDSFETY